MSTPTAPLSADVSRAVARYKAASAAIAIASDVMTVRDLTEMESSDFEFVQDVMRESRATLAAAGRLDLIGGA
jgi:hypothetical protein